MKKSWVLWAFLAFATAVVVNESGGFGENGKEAKLSQEERSFASALDAENRRTFVAVFTPEQRKLAIKCKELLPNIAVQTVDKEIAIEIVQNNDFAETTLIR